MSRTSELLSLFFIFNSQSKKERKEEETITVKKEAPDNKIPYEGFTDLSQKIYVKEELILPDDIEINDGYQELNNMEINNLLKPLDTDPDLVAATKSKATKIRKQAVNQKKGKKRKACDMTDHFMESYCVKCKKVYCRSDFRKKCRICKMQTKFRCGLTECGITYESVPELKIHMLETS